MTIIVNDDFKEKIKGKTIGEVKDMIRNNEVNIPKDPEERNQYLLYASKPPEERDSEKPEEETVDNPSADPVAPDSGNEPSKESVADDTTGEWWKDMGYASAAEAIPSLKKVHALNQQLQSTLDSINAKEGMRGRELKELKEKKIELERLLEEEKKKNVPDLVEPTKPIPPNPADYEDGVADEKYATDSAKYQSDLLQYVEDRSAYDKAETQKLLDQLKVPEKKEVSKSGTKSEENWNKLLDDDIPRFQKEYGCETSVSVRRIHETLVRIDPNKNSDEEDRKRATVLYNSFPEEDRKTYEKIRVATEGAYNFTPDGPVPKYVKGLETAIRDLDMLGEGKAFNKIETSSLEPDEEKKLREEQQRKNEEAVDPIPGDKLAGNDGPPEEPDTKEAKTKRYKDLTDAFNKAIRSGVTAKEHFMKSPDFDEYKKLGVELGYMKASAFTR